MMKMAVLILLSTLWWPIASTPGTASTDDDQRILDLGSRREIFVDDHLIEKISTATLVMHHPRDEGTVLRFDRAWEGPFSGHISVIKDVNKYKLYYRGLPKVSHDPRFKTTCYAESDDGINWIKPNLRLHEIQGTLDNNVILVGDDGTQSFAPFLDRRPGVPESERFKALGVRLRNQDGSRLWLVAFASADGIHWSRMRDDPVMSHAPDDYAFDSHNVSFWSESEQLYVAYFRTWGR